MVESTIKEGKKGQLEINGIDTPMGKACQEFIDAKEAVRLAQDRMDSAMGVLIKEIKGANKRTIKFEGNTLQYKPGHETPEKIRIMPGDS